MEWQGLKALYETYGRELLLYLFSLCKNKPLAEDLLQETFVKAYFSLSPQHKNIRAWLYFVARNLYFDHLKKEKPLISYETEGQDDSLCPEKLFLKNEKIRCLYRCLNRLDDRKREVLMMQYFGHMTHRDIGKVLNIRSDYVRVLGCRAKKELKEMMKEDGYDLP